MLLYDVGKYQANTKSTHLTDVNDYSKEFSVISLYWLIALKFLITNGIVILSNVKNSKKTR